jgi:hypothetical protein
MSVLSVRIVLPVVTAVVSTLFLATAVPHDLLLESPAPTSLLRAEVQGCVMDGRDADECLDEADGKALVEHADWLARNDSAARRASR